MNVRFFIRMEIPELTFSERRGMGPVLRTGTGKG